MTSPNRIIANLTANPTLNSLILLVARIMLALIFIVAGFGKLTAYAGTAQYMQSMGVPAGLLPIVILTELGGGLAILLGFQTRFVAFLLAGFSIVTGLIFHAGNDQTSQIMLMKNITMAGGFLVLMVQGAGRLSIDRE